MRLIIFLQALMATDLPATHTDLFDLFSQRSARTFCIASCSRHAVAPGEFFSGCENCPFLDMVDNVERVNACTSAFYEGQAAFMDPRESWAAKWIRADNYLPGVYALSITGTFDREIEEDLEARGIRWRCRPPPSS